MLLSDNLPCQGFTYGFRVVSLMCSSLWRSRGTGMPQSRTGVAGMD